MSGGYDVIIKNGRWFDGLGSPSAVRHLGISGGRVKTISATPLSEAGCPKVIDADGQWVLPGFVDVHTHYDAEVLVAPGLGESVRHGVTTVFVGSCSLSTVHVNPLDGADLFSRVEALPREHVLSALERHKSWSTAAGYASFLESLPLGPNVASFLGHSDMRTHVMGLGRAVDENVQPTEQELAQMEALLEDALDAGFVGMSTMTNPWDKLDGDRYRSKPLPSTFATWDEYRRFHEVLRRRGRVLQSAPNLTTPVNALSFFFSSMGALWRRPLKTSLLTAADSKAAPFLVRLVGLLTTAFNVLFKSEVKWQHVPVPFEVYADGIDLVVFEEFGAGRAALHLKDEVERNELLQQESYRRRFRRDYERKFSPRVWNRDFYDAQIVGCPDAGVVGKSFGQVADERGIHPVDAYLDLVVEHGKKLRWRTTIANHRPEVLDRLATRPEVQMGFADSGAHLRNMAFYSFSVRLLRRVNDAASRGAPFIGLEHAVHRLTGELARWFGIDAGTLCEGDRADVVVIDPRGLDASVDAYYEAPIPEFGGMNRMVNRSDAAVSATLIGGRVVFEHGAFTPGYGASWRSGRFLRAGEPRGIVERRRHPQHPGAGRRVSAPRRSAAPPRRTQQERRETTIHKLVEATIESLLEVGFVRTTVKEICKRAGLSHGALFRFFPSVLDLVLAASEEVGRRQIAEYKARFARTKGRGNPLLAALLLLRDACRSETNTVFYELLVAARTDRALRKAMQAPMKRYYQAIRDTAHQVPGLESLQTEDLEVLLFTAIHTFDGESLARIVMAQPHLEERRMELLVSVLRASLAMAQHAPQPAGSVRSA